MRLWRNVSKGSKNVSCLYSSINPWQATKIEFINRLTHLLSYSTRSLIGAVFNQLIAQLLGQQKISYMKILKHLFVLLLLGSSIYATAQEEITSAGSDFSFSFLQNRLRPQSTTDRSFQPMNENHEVISLMIYVSNVEATQTDVNVSFTGNDGLNNLIAFRYEEGGQVLETAEANFSLDVDETKEVEVIVTERIEWFEADGTTSLGLQPNMARAMLMDNGHKQEKVFKVSTTNGNSGTRNKVTVFAESSQLRSRDAALILPNSALGNEYYAFTAQTPTGLSASFEDDTKDAGNNGGPSEIAIVAVEDNTYIEVSFPDATAEPWTSVLDGYKKWKSVKGVNVFELNAGEALQLQSDDEDLTGVHIRGFRNDPSDFDANETPIRFAVFSGNMATNIAESTQEAYDHIYEQMYPINTWSCSYIGVNTLYGSASHTTKKDYYRVLTARDGTSVTIAFGDGTSTVTKTLDKGQVLQVNYNTVVLLDETGTAVGSPFSYSYGSGTPPGVVTFDADGPISVAQYVASDNQTSNDNQDPSMTLLAPLDQAIDEISFPLPPLLTSGSTTKQDRISLVRRIAVGQDDIEYTLTQGTNTASALVTGWTTVPSNTNFEYAVAQITFNPLVFDDEAPMSIKLEYDGSSSANQGFNAYLYGLDFRESYGCAAGISALPRGTGPDRTVCVEPGESVTDIQLSAFGGDNPANSGTYTWVLTDGPGNFETTQSASTVLDDVNAQNPRITFSLTEKGVYTFSCTIEREGTCDITWDQLVIVQNCCEARLNEHFDIRYSRDRILDEEVNVWSNKVYVDDFVTLTVDGGVLDVSNVDVVLGECAQIVLTNGAILRANNSVFRACNAEFPWKGIHFESTAGTDNQINESTFKYAIRALEFENEGGVISNNLFYNNYIGVDVSNETIADFKWPVSGNRFVVDRRQASEEIFTVTCDETLEDKAHFGILAANVNFKEPVSHNEFLNSFELAPDQKKFKGIVMSGSNATVSYNTFTNMFKSITLDDVQASFVVQSNDIELTSGKENISPQIEVFATDAQVFIANNRMTSVNEWTGSKHLAIYAEGSSGLDIYANDITGFNAAIFTYQCRNLDILDNKIQGAISYGIYVEGQLLFNNNTKIGCNQIDMDFRSEDVNSVGIGFKYLSTNSNIYNNCVLDCYVSIYGTCGAGDPQDIPFIYNNFLYNYYAAGLYTIYYNSPTLSGLSNVRGNSFFSNTYTGTSTGGAWDVFAFQATGTFYVNRSFGIGVVSSSVSEIATALTYSTASCASQVYFEDGGSSDYPSINVLDADFDCDGGIDNWFGLFTRNDLGSISGMPSLTATGQNWNTPNTGEDDFIGTIKMMASNELYEGLEAVYEGSVTNESLTEIERNRIEYHYWMAKGEMENAAQVLQAMKPVEQLDIDWKTLQTIRMGLMMGGLSIDNLSIEVLQQLEAIIDRDHSLSDAATALHNRAVGGKEYTYATVTSPEVDPADEQNALILSEMMLEVYPNPAQDQLTVTFVGNAEGVNPELEITNALGQRVETAVLSISAGTVSLDISTLDNGVYVVRVLGDESGTLTTRFVKQ